MRITVGSKEVFSNFLPDIPEYACSGGKQEKGWCKRVLFAHNSEKEGIS
jgi:hypothetical protein